MILRCRSCRMGLRHNSWFCVLEHRQCANVDKNKRVTYTKGEKLFEKTILKMRRGYYGNGT